MCLAHFGVGVFILGATMVSAYNVETDVPARPGDRFEVGGYEILFRSVRPVEGPNFSAEEGEFELRKDGSVVSVLASQQRVYRVQQTPMTEAAIDTRIGRDVFVALGEPLGDNAWSVRIQVKPLIRFLWLGAVLMVLGGLVRDHGSALPSAGPRERAGAEAAAAARRRRRAEMWRYAIPLVLLAVIAAFFYRGLSLNPSYVPSALIGKQMPEFSLPSLTDPIRAIGSRDIDGKVALLNVWGTWCVECRHEHGFLVQLARAGRADLRLESEGRSRRARSSWLGDARQSLRRVRVRRARHRRRGLGRDGGARDVPDRPRRQGAPQAHLAADAAGLAHATSCR